MFNVFIFENGYLNICNLILFFDLYFCDFFILGSVSFLSVNIFILLFYCFEFIWRGENRFGLVWLIIFGVSFF